MFRQNTNEFWIFLIMSYAFPYVALIMWSRSFYSWAKNLFTSGHSLILFTAAFISIWLLFTNFPLVLKDDRWSLSTALQWSLSSVSVLFFGLVVIVIFTAINAPARPKHPFDVLIAGVTGIFHVFFFFNLLTALFA